MPKLSGRRLASGLRSSPALYVLGAGASHPIVPMTDRLAKRVADLHWLGGTFPVSRPVPDYRTKTVTDRAVAQLKQPYLPDQLLRREIIERMAPGFVQMALWHELASSHPELDCPDNYAVFDLFPPSLLLNYNLDVLAQRWCAQRHQVVNVHGNVDLGLSGPQGRELVRLSQEYGLEPIDRPDQILFEEENYALGEVFPRDLGHWGAVVVVGYSFGRTSRGYDDALSLVALTRLLQRSPRPVIVVDPYPEPLAELLAHHAKSNRVYQAALRWDLAATAMLQMRREGRDLGEFDRLYGREGTRRG